MSQLTSRDLISSAPPPPPADLNVQMRDLEELSEFQGRKREEFEKHIRKDLRNTRQWLAYANFEAEQSDMARARSILERAISFNRSSVQLWARYAALEIRAKNINRARNVLERAVRILPTVDKLWYEYAGLEASLGNTAGVLRVYSMWVLYTPKAAVFERWIDLLDQYKPKSELSGAQESTSGHVSSVRAAYERYVEAHPTPGAWARWAEFENRQSVSSARKVFASGVELFRTIEQSEAAAELIGRWAVLEEKAGDVERARTLLQQGVALHSGLVKQYATFEKKHGEGGALLAKRAFDIRERLAKSPTDYSSWWELADITRSVDVLKEASAHEPKERDVKNDEWRVYVLLCLRMCYELELQGDIEGSRDGYSKLIEQIPHKKFTFSKAWVAYAHFEIRQGDIQRARKILGHSLGVFKKHKTFKEYISLEKRLKEMDRVRRLYEQYISSFAQDWQLWREYASLEASLGDLDRAKGIYELSRSIISNPALEKSYAKFLAEECADFDGARSIFSSIVETDKNNIKGWIQWAVFEASVPSKEQLSMIEQDEDYEVLPTPESIEKGRRVFERALAYFRAKGLSEERVVLLEAWKQYEEAYGDDGHVKTVESKMPVVIRGDGGVEYTWAEDEESNKADEKMRKFMEGVKKWKKAKAV